MSDEDIAGAMRSWAEHVSAGYVVPAAGGVMVTAADRIEALAAENAALREALSAANGYLLNAKIDLETGAPKRTAITTIEGGIRRVRAALQETKP